MCDNTYMIPTPNYPQASQIPTALKPLPAPQTQPAVRFRRGGGGSWGSVLPAGCSRADRILQHTHRGSGSQRATGYQPPRRKPACRPPRSLQPQQTLRQPRNLPARSLPPLPARLLPPTATIFSNNSSGWNVGSTDVYESSYNSSGFYEMGIKKAKSYVIANPPPILPGR